MHTSVLLEVKNLKKYFPVQKGMRKRVVAQVKALDDVNLFIRQGETLGLVGESGCGKTTTGRAILRLIEPTAGSISFRSRKLAEQGKDYQVIDIVSASSEMLKCLRREMQIIFQDPFSSLNPRKTVATIVGEPIAIHTKADRNQIEEKAISLLEAVGLKSEHMRRYPHEFSGGQRQRICIARALSLEPELIIADEPVSALDVSIQAQVINLLKQLQEKFSLTYLFITHDLSLAKYTSDRVAVMYLGKIVELAQAAELFTEPKHPYTEALISAVPIPDPNFKQKRIVLQGDVPSPVNPPSGCYFHPRCRYAVDICGNETPVFRDLKDEHFVSCHLADSLVLQGI